MHTGFKEWNYFRKKTEIGVISGLEHTNLFTIKPLEHSTCIKSKVCVFIQHESIQISDTLSRLSVFRYCRRKFTISSLKIFCFGSICRRKMNHSGIIEMNIYAICCKIELNSRLWEKLVDAGVITRDDANFIQVNINICISSVGSLKSILWYIPHVALFPNNKGN